MDKPTDKDMMRVNFLMKRNEYAQFQRMAERGSLRASQVLRWLVRSYIQHEKKNPFGKSILREISDGVFGEPEMPKDEALDKEEQS